MFTLQYKDAEKHQNALKRLEVIHKMVQVRFLSFSNNSLKMNLGIFKHKS